MDSTPGKRIVVFLTGLLILGWSVSRSCAQAPPAAQAPPTSPATPAQATPTAPPPEPPDKVVLKVGNQQFTKADFDFLVQGLAPQQLRALALQGKKPLAEQFALVVMLAQHARDLHLDETPAFKRALSVQTRQLEFKTAYEEISRQATVTPEEAQRYYNEHAADFDEISMRQIYIRVKPVGALGASTPPPNAATVLPASGQSPQSAGAPSAPGQPPSPAGGTSASNQSPNPPSAPPSARPPQPPGLGLSMDEAKAKAEAIRQALLAGTDAKKVMEEFKSPGNITIDAAPRKVRHGGMPPEMEKVVFALKPNEVSAPVSLPNALIFFQVIARDPRQLKDVTPEIERTLRQQKIDSEIADLKKSFPLWMDEQYFGTPGRSSNNGH